MDNKLIVYMSSLDICDMTYEQMKDTADMLIKSVSITKLKRAINQTCKTLAGVTEPRFGANLNFIWRDNQDRLNLIWRLMDYSENFERYFNNIKQKRRGLHEDSEYLYGFISQTQDVLKTIKDVYEFKLKENQTAQLGNQNIDKKLLKEGDSNE